MCAIEPLMNWQAFQLKPESEGSDRGESDPLRWKDDRPLLPRAGRVLLQVSKQPGNTLAFYHSTCGVTRAATEP